MARLKSWSIFCVTKKNRVETYQILQGAKNSPFFVCEWAQTALESDYTTI